MPQDLTESVSGSVELVFPDDASRTTYRLKERAVYGAEEVQDEAETDGVPQYGQWLPVDVLDEREREAWLNAPSQLRQRLVELEVGAGQEFTIDRMEKTGHRESAPYQVDVTVTGDGTGQRDLKSAAGDD